MPAIALHTAPANRTAALVASKGQDTEHADRRWDNHWIDRPATHDLRSVHLRAVVEANGFEDLTGVCYGHLMVLGLLDRRPKADFGAWLVRCLCGRYETRRAKSVRKGLAAPHETDKCRACNQLDYARRGMRHGTALARGTEGAIVASQPSGGGEAHRRDAMSRSAPAVPAARPATTSNPAGPHWDPKATCPPRSLPARFSPSKQAFLDLGFGLGDGSPGWAPATLPPGWTWPASGVPVPATCIRDGDRRRRVSIVAGRASGAYARLLPRYSIVTLVHGRGKGVPVAEGRQRLAVADAGKPLRWSVEFAPGDVVAKRREEAALTAWLDAAHPHHADPTRHWDDEQVARAVGPGFEPWTTCDADTPLTGTWPGRDAFAALGFRLVREGAGQRVSDLPAGWVRREDGSFVDRDGNLRAETRMLTRPDGARIAVLTLLPRRRFVHVRVSPVTPGAHGPTLDRTDAVDGATVMRSSPAYPTLDMPGRGREDAALQAWLDREHPGHGDPLVGW